MDILFLGTGTSTGVPQIGCQCPVCSSDNPKNKRLRSSVFVQAEGLRVLIDSSPDLRQQALREHITAVDAVFYTHAHVDHIGGFDDLRAFCWFREEKLPLYAHPGTLEILETMYPWAFFPKQEYQGYVRAEACPVTKPFRLGSWNVEPLPVNHAAVDCLAYHITVSGKRLVYMPDVKSIPESSLERMKGADLVILDGLRHTEHPTHFSLEESLAAIEAIAPHRAYLTHMSHQLDYETLSRELPDHVRPAYDGLKLTIEEGNEK